MEDKEIYRPSVGGHCAPRRTPTAFLVETKPTRLQNPLDRPAPPLNVLLMGAEIVAADAFTTR